MDEQAVRNIIREELAFMVKNKKLVFPYPMQILDGNDITIGQTIGTRLGNTTSLIGFYGHTPVTRGTLIPAVTGGATQDLEARTIIGTISYELNRLGLTS